MSLLNGISTRMQEVEEACLSPDTSATSLRTIPHAAGARVCVSLRGHPAVWGLPSLRITGGMVRVGRRH